MQHGPGSLNRIYRLVWNDSLGTFVAVAECARGRGKRSKVVGAVMVAGLLGSGLASAAGANGPPAATALPTGASVVAGQASVRQSGARMDIEQTSTRAAINWLSFDIGAQAKVQVQMPTAQSVSLNRVIGADPSALFGQLSSNGQVVLVNPNGIVFGAGSRVDVGGLVASAMDIRTTDFMAGRMLFSRGDSTASVLNQGTLTAGPGGYIALLAPEVRNEGVVSAQFGTVALAAGEAVTMDLAGSALLGVKVDPASVKALVDNRQLIQAEGGQVLMSAGAARHLLSQAVAGQAGADQLVESQGVVRLVTSSGRVSVGAGRIAVEGSTVDLAGQLSASGAQAGEVRVSADYLGQSGQIDANAAAGTGGQVQLEAGTLIQTASAKITADGATGGGQVRITGAGDQSRLYSSAEVTARGLDGEAHGGRVVITADSVELRAAQIDASGAGAGGDVRIGGGFHGAETGVPNAREVGLNASTRVRADAGAAGDGGSVVVWSDATTTYAGQISARGGQTGGDGGSVEVSGKGTLAFAGQVDVSAPAGQRGSLLLDPRNILIDDAASAVATLDLADPTPSATNGFGTTAQVLANGNVVITAPNADTGATTGTGAAYLFDTRTGALLSNLRGSYAGDHVGSAGIYALSTGHYLVLSPSYYTQSGKTYFSKSASDAGATTDAQPHASAYALLSGSVSAGAITWQSATGSNGGASSLVSTANSLVGSSATDTRTTYNGKNASTGSATVTANDELGKVGYYDSLNGVDVPGTTTLHQLTDGSVAVATPYWYNGRGAVTWINGGTGALTDGSHGAAISATVSLVGSTGLRSQAVTSTDSSSHTVYVSSTTSALPYTATYNGNANAPMRSNAPGGAGDFVGQEVLALPGGGYAVASPMWTNGAYVYAGAVTHGAAGGTAGAVGTSNSLHGDRSFDFVGSGGLRATGTTGSHYLVQSPLWTATGNAAAGKYLQNNPDGAVTWVDGSTGQPYAAGSAGAAISSSNSLIGTAGDALGAFSHVNSSPGYYSYDYNVTTYVSTYPYAAGRVMPSGTGLQALRNGHYLVVDNAGFGGRGSVTFGNGDSGVAGVVSSSNSLVGGTSGDMTSVTVTELAGSHYVVDNPTWTNPTGSKSYAGAVTWGSGTSGVTGTVSATNSLVGTDTYEQVGSGGIRPVGATGANGLATNYLVLSPLWGNRAGAVDSTVAFGAVTWVSGSNGRAFGAAGTGATVSSSNSLVGNSAGDYVGSYHQSDSRLTGNYNNGASQIFGSWHADLTATVDVLDNGDYVVRSPSWGAGKGAITRAAGGTGIAGTLSASNSLVGSTSDVYATVSGSHTAAGSTWADTTYYLTTTGDHVGLLGTALSGGQYVAISPSWGNGRGAITWVGSGASTGTVGSANSLVGSTQDVFSDANHSTLVSTGDRLGTMANSNWAVPIVSVRNSDGYTTTSTRSRAPYQLGAAWDATAWNGLAYVVVGKNYGTTSVATTAFESDGYGGMTSHFAFNATPIAFKLSNGNVLLGSPSWNNTGAAGAGAITWLNGSNGQFADASSGGTLSATNSLVGSHTSDNLGYALPAGGAVELSNGNAVVVNPQWHDERGAVTWVSGTAGRTGTISASNSLVGDTPSGSITVTAPYNTTTGYTPYRYVNGLGWVSGWVDRGSDLKGDQVGRGGVTALADGNYVVASPFWQVDQASTVGLVPASRGAATWGNGSNGQFFGAATGGSISASNSLVGSAYGDAVSYAVWDFYGPNSPAAYPGNDALSISTTPAYAYVMPGVTALAGGRYAVASPYWANGSATEAGAVTFSAAGGLAGAVSTGNSLTGSHSGDHVGKGLATVDPYTWGFQWTPGVMTMTTGGATNYLVRASDWTNDLDTAGGGAGAGALTWVNGANGHALGDSGTGAAVSSSNSLVGNVAGDGVGLRTVALQRTVGGVTTNTGDLLSISNLADCEPGVGAVTLIPGGTGLAGPVSWRNSVIGLAPSSQGLNSSAWDPNYSVYTTDIHYTLLPSAVTAAEQVQYRPLVWVTPNATSGNNATHATVMTVVAENTASPTTADLVNTGGNANWESSLLAGNTAGFTGVGGNTSTGLLGFASNTGADVVITPTALTGLLNAGTDVTLQASNDITVLKAVTTSAGGHGGDLTLEAGRSVRIQAPITTDNGNFTAIANQTVAGGVVDADCSTCFSQIVMTPGASVNTGTGALTLSVLNSTDKTANAAGPLVVGDLAGRAITVSNQGLDATSRGMGIRFGADADLGTAATESLTLLARGTSALGGGLVLASDTALQGAATGQLLVGASDTSLAVTLGGSTGGLALTAAEIGSVIHQSSGFDQLHFGRTDQTGATTVAAMNFTGTTMQRGGATLDADLVLQGGSGGLSTTGSLTSGAATDRALELSVTGGTLALGASQTLTAATGDLVLSAHGSGSSVTQNASHVLNATRLLLDGTGSHNLATGNSNTIGTLAGDVGSAQVRTTSGHLTVGSVAGVAGFTADTGLLLRANGASSDLVLNQPVTLGSGVMSLVAGRNFTNNNPLDTGLDAGTGRYFVYSTNPTASLEAMTGYAKHYNQSYTGTAPAYASSGNWFLYSVAPTLTASVGAGATAVYGDSASAPGITTSGLIDGDTWAAATTGSLATSLSSYTPSHAGFIPAGNHTLTLTGQGTLADRLGYTIAVTPGSSTLTVQPKAISLSGLSADSKVYDGTTTTTVSGTASLQGSGATASDGRTMAGDTVSVSGTATGAFADRHVGTAKSVTLSGVSLSGADAGNYTISAGSVTADITPKALTLSGLSTAASKVYDGNTTAVVTGTAALASTEAAGAGTTSDGRPYSGDTLSLGGSATGAYDSANVASATTVQFGGITLGGAQAGNYTLVQGQQAATITPKPLTAAGLTATDRVYDATTAATLTGTAALTAGAVTATDGRHVTGDTVSITGTAAGTFADAHVGTGKTVSVTGLSLTGASAGNYSLSPVTTTATITARSLDLDADAQSKTYGDADPTLTVRVGGQGLVGSDTQAGVLSGALATATGASAAAGTHAITQGNLAIASNDYQLGQFTAGTLTVAKAALTVTADAARKTYGDADPSLTYTVNPAQLKYTDTASAVSGVSLSTATGASATAGTHAITATGGTAANYTLTLADNTLTVDKAALTVTADAARKTYGDADPTLTYAVDPAQLKYTDTASVVSGVNLSAATGANATAGTHTITAAGGTAANYDLTLANNTLTVDKAALTVTADAKRKTYGDTDPTLTYAVNTAQLKYTDSDSVVSGVNLSTATGASATAGTHAITATGGAAANYTLTLADNTLTVDKAALNVTADAQRKTFGAADPALTYTVDPTQLKYTDAASVVSGVNLSTATGATATAGTHTITATGGTAANYDLTLANNTLTVDKAALTVTADAKRKTYGNADPTLTYAVNTAQLKYTDSDSVVSGVNLSTATGANATAGTHTITATGGTAANYDLTLASNTLTVDKAALTVTADAKRKTYGDTDPTLTYAVNASQLKYTDTVGVVSGVSLSTATGASATAGTHTISGSAGTAANYDVTLSNGVLTVDKAALTVTANDQRKAYGDTDPALTYTVNAAQLKYTDTASVVGSVNLSAPTGASATAGSHAITGAGGTAANYDVNLVNGTLTVDKAALTVTADAKRKTYGDADPSLTYAVNTAQLKYTDSDSVVSGVALSTATGSAATAGTHAITTTGGTAANYTLSLANNTLTVDKASLAVTADAQRKTYGDAEPTLTYSVDPAQLKYTDTAAVVRDVQLATATGGAATAGSHAITASGGTADNYTVSATGNTLTVDKAALTVVADPQRKTYGATDPTLTYSVDPTQLRYTDTLGVVSGVNLSTATGAAATAGTHTIAIAGGTAANYAISLANGTLTVDKASLVVAADVQRKVYGDADPTLTYRVDPTQLRYTDTAAVVTGVNLSTTTGAAATAGTHLISGTVGTAANYDVSVAPATLTVDKAPLSVTANNQRKTYGDAEPTLTYTVNAAQLKYTDSATAVQGLSLSTATGAAATAGTHAITGSTSQAANYDVTLTPGTLTVDKAALTVSANDVRKVYGDADPSLAYTVNAAQLKYTDAANVVSGVNLSAPTGAAATAGTHVVAASGGTATNYDVTLVNGTLTVEKAALTVSANDARKVYGDADPSLAYTVNASQLKYTDAANVVSGVHLSATTGAAATAGIHVVAASGGVAANYAITTTNGTLTVDKAALAVSVNNARKVYGDADPALGYTVNSAQLKYTDAANVVSGVNLSTATGVAATAGTHLVTASGGAAANYVITTANGMLTVDKAALTVFANDARKVYGDADPSLGYTVNAAQLKYADAASVVSSINLSAPTGAAATAGTHVVAATGGTATNYDVTLVNGTLTVEKAALTVSANNARKVYGDADPTLAYTVNAAELKYTDTASIVSGVNLSAATGAAATAGTHVVAASGGVAANYAITTTNGTLTVDKAALTVSANNARKVYGDADPTLGYSVNAAQLKYADAAGVVSGVNLSTATGAAATAGTHLVTASGGTAANYVITTANGTLTVDKAALAVSANNARKVYGDADPALGYTVNAAQLKYTDAANVVSGVTLSAPTGAAATAGTHVVAASGGTAANYAITTANGMLTVDKAALTVSANDARKVYGDTDPSLAYTVNTAQLKYADAASVVSGVNLSAPTGAAATAGTHVVVASGGLAANYAITPANGKLTVDKAQLTVTADDKSKTAGEADPALTYEVNAAQLRYGDAQDVARGVKLTAPLGAGVPVGTHTIAASDGVADNYDLQFVSGTLTVKASVGVKAETLSNPANTAVAPSTAVGTGPGSTNPAGSLVVRDGGVANTVVPPSNSSGSGLNANGANAAGSTVTASSDGAGSGSGSGSGTSGSAGSGSSTASSQRAGSSDAAPASITFGITEGGGTNGNGNGNGNANAGANTDSAGTGSTANTAGTTTASDARPAASDTTTGKASSSGEKGSSGQAGTSTSRSAGTSATRTAADEAASPEAAGKLMAVRPQTQVAFGTGQSVSFEAASAFVQPPNTSVSYSVTLSDGRPLPAWVKFDPVVGTLSGKAPSDWTGKLDVIVTAVTESGVAASARVSFEPGTSR